MKNILLIILFISASICAQNEGTSGLSFLKLGYGARNIAMADAGNSASNDVTSLFYNPAKLPSNPTTEIFLMHNSWMTDVRSEVFGVKTYFLGLPIAAGVNVTSIEDIQVREIASEEPLTTFNSHYFFASLSTAYEIIPDLSAGVTVKYLFENIYNDEATGIGFDIGASYKTSIEGLAFSTVIKNIGSMSELRNKSSELPNEFRIGASYAYKISDFKISGALDYLNYLNENSSHVLPGLEILYNDHFALRAGYQSGFEARNLSFGAGIYWGILEIDYAFVPMKYNLGNSNLFSLKIKF